jgi:hypothetical protein
MLDNHRVKPGPNTLRRRRILRFLIWLVAVIALLSGSGFASAQGEERLAFLDEDPVEFDLDQPPGASQTVEVINGDSQALGRLELRVIGLPADVVTVEPPEQTGLKAGAIAKFTLTRKGKATAGTGHLVAVGSNRAIARRTIVLRGNDLGDVVLSASSWKFLGECHAASASCCFSSSRRSRSCRSALVKRQSNGTAVCW